MQGKEKDANLRERMSDATSDETLSELEEEQKTGADRDKDDDVPNPNSEPINRREERDDAGPM